MKDIDHILITPMMDTASSCVSRVQVARHFFTQQGHEVTPKIGTLWLWDEAESRFDTVHDFHCWLWMGGSLWDSFGGIKKSLNILARKGMPFKLSKSIENWKAFELSMPQILDGTVSMDRHAPAIMQLLHKYRQSFGYDAIFVEGLVMPEWQNDLNEIRAQVMSEPVFD